MPNKIIYETDLIDFMLTIIDDELWNGICFMSS